MLVEPGRAWALASLLRNLRLESYPANARAQTDERTQVPKRDNMPLSRPRQVSVHPWSLTRGTQGVMTLCDYVHKISSSACMGMTSPGALEGRYGDNTGVSRK